MVCPATSTTVFVPARPSGSHGMTSPPSASTSTATKKMHEEADRLRWDHLTENFRAPLKIIAAAKGVLVPGARQYLKLAQTPKSLTIIKDATHYFDDAPGMQEQVFKLSKQWFDRF